MDKCPCCNKIILSDYVFCSRCGTPLKEDARPKVPAETQITETSEEDSLRFFDLARSLSTASNIDHLLRKIGTAAETILGADRSAILLLDEKKENLYFKTATGEEILKKISIPVSKGIAGWIATNRKGILVNDPYSDERFSPETDKKTGYLTRSIAGVPMIAGEELVGVVEVVNKKEGKFNQRDLDNLKGFAGLAAVNISNTRLKAGQENILSNILDYLVMGSESLGSSEGTSKGHTWEMDRLASVMTKVLELSNKQRKTIHRAATLHDIGFLGLENPDLLGFNIPDNLSEEAKFRLHPVIGSEMIKRIKPLADAAPYIANHHRYKNGEGFPENIPPEAITAETEVISILEDYLTCRDKNKINYERYSGRIREAFLKIIPD